MDGRNDLAGVRAFVAVADHGHVGRAAQALGVGRNAAAARLSSYEGRVGRTLVDRSHRRVISLTAAGQALLPTARELLAVAAAHDSHAHAVGTGSTGIVRVAVRVEPRGLVDLLLLAVEAVDDRWRVDVQRPAHWEIGRRLAYGELDAALTRGRPGAPCGHHPDRPNKHERVDGIRIGDYGCGLYVSWRARWTGPHAEALIGTARAVVGALRTSKTQCRREEQRRASALSTAELLADVERRRASAPTTAAISRGATGSRPGR